jgi:hypothetical protein
VPRTAILSPHRLTYDVGVPGARTHIMHIYLSAVASGDADGYDFVGFSANSGMSAEIARLVALLQPIYNTSTAIGPFQLEKYVSGSYVPIALDSTSVFGTTGSAYQPAQEVTMLFECITGTRIKHLCLETPYAYTGKFIGNAGAPSPFIAYTNSVVNNAAAHLGNWVRGRDNSHVSGVKSIVFDINRKIRRERGLS